MRILRLLRKQDGFALVMSIGTLCVLTLSGTTMMVYTSSNAKTAGLSKADESTFSLSEAALNNAMAVLSNPSNNALDPDLLPSTEATATYATYEGGTAKWWGTFDRSQATWTLTALGLSNNPAGPSAAPVRRVLRASVLVTPTLLEPPNNPAWDYIISKQVTGALCDMTLADGTNTGNKLTVNARLYVFGNLCIGTSSGGTADIKAGPLMVMGKTTIQEGSSAIGSSTTPINEAHIKLGCKFLSNAQHNPCQQGSGASGKDNLWASVIDSSPAVLTPPTADFAGWYENAIPGPAQTCTTISGTPPMFDTNYPSRDNGAGTFDLTPASSYTCRVGPGASSTLLSAMNATQTSLSLASSTGFPTSAFRIKVDDELMDVTAGFGTTSLVVTRGVNGTTAASHVVSQTAQWDTPPSGEISWNATTKRLAVSGTIYIDGSAKVTNGAANVYDGFATIYLSGTFLMNNASKLCTSLSGSSCNFAGWNPTKKMLAIVADGTGGQNPAGVSVYMKDAGWQGAVYGTGQVRFEGTTRMDGPAIASEVELGYNISTGSGMGGFSPFTMVPVGVPGAPVVYAHPNPPIQYPG
jgi:hypothetical protein